MPLVGNTFLRFQSESGRRRPLQTEQASQARMPHRNGRPPRRKRVPTGHGWVLPGESRHRQNRRTIKSSRSMPPSAISASNWACSSSFESLNFAPSGNSPARPAMKPAAIPCSPSGLSNRTRLRLNLPTVAPARMSSRKPGMSLALRLTFPIEAPVVAATAGTRTASSMARG